MTNGGNKTKELIARAKSGDQQAFADLYDSYYAYAYCAIGDIIIDQGEREDVVQEAFLRCFTKLQQGESVENFGGFIATAAKNIAKDHIKAREAEKRPKEVLSSFGQSDGDAEEDDRDLFDAERSEVQKELERASEFYQTPEERFEEQEVAEIIQEILAELPDYQQEALSLFYLEGMKQKEIADLYGVSVDTVKSRINQGKKKVEAKVIEIEKKKGIKLHTFAPLPFFLFLLRQKAVAEAAAIPNATFLTGATEVGQKSISAVLKQFFAKNVTIAGKAISTKVITGVIIGAVATGSIIGVTSHKTNEPIKDVSSNDTQEDGAEYDKFLGLTDEEWLQLLDNGEYDTAYNLLHQEGYSKLKEDLYVDYFYDSSTDNAIESIETWFENDGFYEKIAGAYRYKIYIIPKQIEISLIQDDLDFDHDFSGEFLYENTNDPEFCLYIGKITRKEKDKDKGDTGTEVTYHGVYSSSDGVVVNFDEGTFTIGDEIINGTIDTSKQGTTILYYRDQKTTKDCMEAYGNGTVWTLELTHVDDNTITFGCRDRSSLATYGTYTLTKQQ